jgi:hypothetical protein
VTRLYVVCEGLTEVNFVAQLLKPHLEAIDPLRLTVGAPSLKGHYTYAQLKKFVKNLLGPPSSLAAVTTMVDLFKIPADYPGIANAADEAPVARVHRLEHECTEDIGDRRFFSHLQLHEFEALLLADLTVLVKQHPNRRKEISDLAAHLDSNFESPEHVDRVRPPSYWIKDAVPEYNKTVDGPITAYEIGLPTLRERCPHFGRWLQHLEDLERT